MKKALLALLLLVAILVWSGTGALVSTTNYYLNRDGITYCDPGIPPWPLDPLGADSLPGSYQLAR